ncbi:hypothetical protein IAT38_003099 [Cryptococcus sp. DSM 104549]
MRAFTYLLSIGLFASALAQPVAKPNGVSPALFAKDPMSIHRRSAVPPPVEVDPEAEAFAPSEPSSEDTGDEEASVEVTGVEAEALDGDAVIQLDADIAKEEDAAAADVLIAAEGAEEDSCEAVCGVHRVEGAKNEREALCSAEGLKTTLSCAQCIDRTWPDTTWEDSAMAEYERIVSACNDSPQRPFRRESS